MPRNSRRRLQDRVHDRRLLAGLVVSGALHVLVFLIFGGQGIPASPFAAAGERRGDSRAARGGGMEAVELRPPTPEQATVPPVVIVPEPAVEEVEPPEPELEVERIPAIALADAFPAAGTPGPAEGLGLATGTGEGDGGTEEEGLFRVVPPRPRHMGAAVFPDRPDRVRGKEIEVWVFVTVEGEVVPDSTRLNPSTGDRGFDRRLREYASEWLFEAARRDGKAVAEWFRYTIAM